MVLCFVDYPIKRAAGFFSVYLPRAGALERI
jgi:hypothetical protein